MYPGLSDYGLENIVFFGLVPNLASGDFDLFFDSAYSVSYYPGPGALLMSWSLLGDLLKVDPFLL